MKRARLSPQGRISPSPSSRASCCEVSAPNGENSNANNDLKSSMLAVNAQVHVQHGHRRRSYSRNLSCLAEGLWSYSFEFLPNLAGEARNIGVTECPRYTTALGFFELRYLSILLRNVTGVLDFRFDGGQSVAREFAAKFKVLDFRLRAAKKRGLVRPTL